ncbi:MAG TPA: CHAT domain-containing protein [Chryseosolibacter sp.]|nr:CHAT domain-containing protein [Chryseosolibacter sp.]
MKKISCLLFLVGSAFLGLAQGNTETYALLESKYESSEYDACIKMVKEVESFTANRMDTMAANSYFYLGDAFLQAGNEVKALQYFEREKELRAKLPAGDGTHYSNSLFNLAFAYLQAGKYPQAGKTAEELLAYDRKLYDANSAEFASTVLSVADIYLKVDRLNEAEKLLKSTLKRYPKNTVIEGQLLTKLGDLYSYRSEFSNATKTLEQATEVLFHTAGDDTPEYTSAAVALGILYMGQGKYPEAEGIFDVALSILDPSEVAYANVLNNQAYVYKSLGQFDRAENLFKKIRQLDSLAVGTQHPDFAVTLSNLTEVLTEAGKYAEAEKAIQLALDIQKKNKGDNTASYARKLNKLAHNYEKSGSPEKAIPFLEDALKIYKKTLGVNSPEYATAEFNLGNAYWKSGKGQEGLKHLQTSASIRGKVLGKNHPKYAESIQKIGEYQWEQKQLKEAHQSFGQVFDNSYFQIEKTFPGMTEEEKTNFFYNKIKGDFEKFNSFVVANSKADPMLLDDMFNYHINTKGAIMQATEKVRRAILTSNDSSLINLFTSWQSQKEQIARAYSQNVEASTLDSLVASANLIEKELAKRSSSFASQFSKQKATWQQIQQLLKPGEACVEVIRFREYAPEKAGAFSDKILYAYLIITSETKDHPILVTQDNGSELESKFIKFYHNSIRYNMEDVRSHGNFFASIGTVLDNNKITKVFFSPDGVYNQLNVNSLKNPATGKYLVDEYDFHLVTNSKELVEKENESVAGPTPILIGFPKFNMQTDVANAGQSGQTRGRMRGATRGGTRELRGLMRLVGGSGGGISELPGTQKEISDISKLFVNDPKVYLAQQASEDIAKSVNNPPYLHIATHGYFLEDEADERGTGEYVTNPMLKAGLIFAGAENFIVDGQPVNDAGDDGILTAYEAMNLRLDNTKLVVLSACETGLGKVKNGEGVYGLQRAFKLAGTQTIVMSLWSVDDDATQELMSTFYTELMKSGNQHESFRIAQQHIKEKYKTPFYWGAFIMVGI